MLRASSSWHGNRGTSLGAGLPFANKTPGAPAQWGTLKANEVPFGTEVR